MTDFEKVEAVLRKLLPEGTFIDMNRRLREDLGLSSLKLIELTVQLHQLHGIDLGKKVVKYKKSPVTVEDLVKIMGMP